MKPLNFFVSMYTASSMRILYFDTFSLNRMLSLIASRTGPAGKKLKFYIETLSPNLFVQLCPCRFVVRFFINRGWHHLTSMRRAMSYAGNSLDKFNCLGGCEYCVQFRCFLLQFGEKCLARGGHVSHRQAESQEAIQHHSKVVKCSVEQDIVEVQVVSDLKLKLLPLPLSPPGCCLLHLIKQQSVPREQNNMLLAGQKFLDACHKKGVDGQVQEIGRSLVYNRVPKW